MKPASHRQLRRLKYERCCATCRNLSQLTHLCMHGAEPGWPSFGAEAVVDRIESPEIETCDEWEGRE